MCPDAGLQPIGDLEEDGIPRGVAPPVVHLLVAVEVQEVHGELGAPATPRQTVLDPLHQQGPVGQSGQRIGAAGVVQPTHDPLGVSLCEDSAHDRRRRTGEDEVIHPPPSMPDHPINDPVEQRSPRARDANAGHDDDPECEV